jgi:hypothetical protein
VTRQELDISQATASASYVSSSETGSNILEKHYGHTSNVASAAELTKGGQFKGGKKAGAVDWLME